jgi:rRNA maturation endonuclease Nob1
MSFAKIEARETLNPAGEVFRAWFQCSECKTAVDLHDRFCRSCGVEFWVPKP